MEEHLVSRARALRLTQMEMGEMGTNGETKMPITDVSVTGYMPGPQPCGTTLALGQPPAFSPFSYLFPLSDPCQPQKDGREI